MIINISEYKIYIINIYIYIHKFIYYINYINLYNNIISPNK